MQLWIGLFLWQFLWLIYVTVTSIFRHKAAAATDDDETAPPDIWHAAIFVLFTLSNVCLTAAVFLLDRGLIEWTLLALVVIPVFLAICISLSTTRLHKHLELFKKRKLKKDIILICLLVHNGLAAFATVCALLFLLNFSMVLHYSLGVDQDLACKVYIALVMILTTFWFIIDICFLDNYMRYVFSPYLVTVLWMSGTVSQNGYSNFWPISIALCAISGVYFILKLVAMACCHRGQANGQQNNGVVRLGVIQSLGEIKIKSPAIKLHNTSEA